MNSADDEFMLFCYFSQKTGFDISCKLSPKYQSLFAGRNKQKQNQNDAILLIVLRKQALTFPQEAVCMKCQNLFARKNKQKQNQNVVC